MFKMVIATAFAVALAYLVNQYMIKFIGEKSIIFIAPIIEEMAKTMPIHYMNGHIFYVHLLFGVVEGIYDWCNSDKNTGKFAGVMSVASHAAFGGITQSIYSATSMVWYALIAGILVHMLWNYFILEIL
ncbi:MAG: hypothetical protein PHP06_00310 [Clostridia bacterium]|nr:hypothetical protein [Clostridia bacterium]